MRDSTKQRIKKEAIILSSLFIVINIVSYLLYSFYTLNWSPPFKDIEFRREVLNLEAISLSIIIGIVILTGFIYIDD